MIELPIEFKKEMQELFRDDYELFISEYDKPYKRGISVNRLKTDAQGLRAFLPFATNPSPFYHDGLVFGGYEQGVGKLALHHAGAFYVQEPSASAAVTILDPQPGEKILDLCAAPGGKSAQIASCLRGRGLLWANEAVKSRSQSLVSNLERMGVRNAIVSSIRPDTLSSRLDGYFDKVLVDAPCSGEGMFRKHPKTIDEWSLDHVKACAARQTAILLSAADCVKSGGILVYSTCTFSKTENEDVIYEFLKRRNDFEADNIQVDFGRSTETKCAVRISPLEAGEGHFIARMKRKENVRSESCVGNPYNCLFDFHKKGEKSYGYNRVQEVLDEIFIKIPSGRIEICGNRAFILPDIMPDISLSDVICAGVFAAEIKKDRAEPTHALFMSSKPSELRRVCGFAHGDEDLYRFLHGEEIECSGEHGYTAVAVDGIVTGFGKCSGGRLKNKYPKGLRLV